MLAASRLGKTWLDVTGSRLGGRTATFFLSGMQVHYRAFPEDALLRWDGMAGLKAHHFSSMKVLRRASCCQHW